MIFASFAFIYGGGIYVDLEEMEEGDFLEMRGIGRREFGGEI